MGRSTDYEVRLRGRELEGCFEGLAADVVPVAVARFQLAVITRIEIGVGAYMFTRPSFSRTPRVFVVL